MAYNVVGFMILATLVLIQGGAVNGVEYNTVHLDSALEYYETLHVDDISSTLLDGNKHVISFRTLGMTFNLHLHPDKSLFTKDFSIYTVENGGRKHPYTIDQNAFMHGHLEGRESDSIVSAHLSSHGVLSAVISGSDGPLYHIEPSHHYIIGPHPFHMVTYSSSHVKGRLNSTKYDYAVPPRSHPLEDYVTHDRLRRQTVNRGNIGGNSCSMIIIADFTAFVMFGRNVDSTISQLVTLVSSVDKLIYRVTDWLVDVNDNVVSGLGHSIQTIMVHTEPSPDPLNYTTARSDVDAGNLLSAMRLEDWSGYCLAHLFTNRNFISGLLGLANIASPRREQTGGVCSTRFNDGQQMVIYNTGLSTFNNNGLQMVLSEMIRVTGHELGHNWGSHHDPSTESCGNRFLMNGFAQDGSEETHMEFSSCSRVSIGEVLLSKASCFMVPSPVCGDFQVDIEEQCDVGPEGDMCCDGECLLRFGAECSDRNSPCCMNCSLAPVGVTCRSGPLTSDCTGDTLCNGINLACLSQPESLDVGAQCIGGVCMEGGSSENRTQCVQLCDSINMTSCICPGEEECLVCCEVEGSSGGCRPFDTTRNLTLSNGASCSDGICIDGGCSDQTQDVVARIWMIITTLDTNAFGVFVRENIVGFVLIFSIPLWCIGSCLIHCLVDVSRKKEYNKSGADRVDIAQWYRKRKEHLHHTHIMVPSEVTPFLSGKGVDTQIDEFPDEFPDEPVDDLPLPPNLTNEYN